MSAEIVKRFVNGFGHRYSIRKHHNGAFQIYHDNPYEGIPQYDQDYQQPLGGLYTDAESAEAELLRIRVLEL